MQILILKASIKVYNPANTVIDPETQKEVTDMSEGNSLIIYANRSIQVVPDWVKDDSTFKAHVKAGSVLIIQTMTVEESDNAETKLIKAEAQAAKAGVEIAPIKTGWGASPVDVPGFTSGLPNAK